jgi:hypothetical protein
VVAMNTDGAVGTAATAIMGIDGRAKSLGRLRTGTSRGAHSE